MKNAVAYMRVSSAEQGKSGFGLISQETEIRAFAKAAGYKLIRLEREVASAVGGEGLSRRPVLKELISFARQHGVPVLISRLDRLSRSATELEEIAGNSGTSFVSIREGKTSNVVVVKSQGARIERETEMLKEATKAGLQRAKAQGKVFGNTRNLKEAQKLGAEANARKAELRRQELEPIITEIREAGFKSAAAIADQLNARSIPTPSGRPWTGPNVRTVLKSITPPPPDDKPFAVPDHYKDDPEYGSF